MILLRCSSVDGLLLEFANVLGRASGVPVVLAVDESRAKTGTGDFPKLSVSRAAMARLGLYTPNDATWRCGDYILYLAQVELGLPEFTWLIEYDVRISEPKAFFSSIASAAEKVDFLSADLRPASEDWFWSQFALSIDACPFRCFFPVTRFSRSAVRLLFQTRLHHSRSLARRAVWPNDEAFVATTLASADLRCADFNTVVGQAWTDDSFQYSRPFRGEEFSPTRLPHLWHPVLFGAAYTAKLERLRDMSGYALGRRINRRVHRSMLDSSHWFSLSTL